MAHVNTLLFAFGLTMFAGMSTVIGSFLVLHVKKIDKKFLSAALGFSAGVMIYVSLIEIFAEAKLSLTKVYGADKGYWYTTLAFFAGIVLIALIDRFFSDSDHPHEILDPGDEKYQQSAGNPELMRVGISSAVAIAIHNFPEGMATFISAMEDPTLGLSIAIAIAIHNIPEGIAIAVPIYYATKDKSKAFLYSFLSGLSEPLGAVVGYLLILKLFNKIVNDAIFGIVFAAVAGIMVYISLDELLPTAEKFGEHHAAIYGLILGMMLMALSLLLLS